jgi:hypothetical protein
LRGPGDFRFVLGLGQGRQIVVQFRPRLGKIAYIESGKANFLLHNGQLPDPTMAKKEHISETPATQLLRKHKVAFTEHPYDYEEHGGTSVSSRELGVDEHHVVKTLVMQDEPPNL